jgi:hypothetical protein
MVPVDLGEQMEQDAHRELELGTTSPTQALFLRRVATSPLAGAVYALLLWRALMPPEEGAFLLSGSRLFFATSITLGPVLAMRSGTIRPTLIAVILFLWPGSQAAVLLGYLLLGGVGTTGERVLLTVAALVSALSARIAHAAHRGVTDGA